MADFDEGLQRLIAEQGVEGVVQGAMALLRSKYPAPPPERRRDARGRVRTWPEGEERPLAFHEDRPSPWRRIYPAKPCPSFECGAVMFRYEEIQKERCANGHVWTDEQLYRMGVR